jgi:hypothetical protein
MDDPSDNLQHASDEYDREQLLKWFEFRGSPQEALRQLPKIESGIRMPEQDDSDEPQSVVDSYLLYRRAISVATKVDQFFEQRFKARGIELAVQVMKAVAELGTVLLNPPRERSSSSIACLKRALGRISSAIETAKELKQQKILSSSQCKELTALLFQIRDGVIVVMGNCRARR